MCSFACCNVFFFSWEMCCDCIIFLDVVCSVICCALSYILVSDFAMQLLNKY